MIQTRHYQACFVVFSLVLASCQCGKDSNESLPGDPKIFVIPGWPDSVDDGAAPLPQESDALLLSRYLDSVNASYRFAEPSNQQLQELRNTSSQILMSTEFQVSIPADWHSSSALRYTADVIVGSDSSDSQFLDSVVYHFESQDVSWLRQTRYGPLTRRAISYDDPVWIHACHDKERSDYLVLPRGYVDAIVDRCPHWRVLARDSQSRPVAWHGSSSMKDLIRGLNLALTELHMTGHRYEVHHDSWKSLLDRRVLRIAAERSPFTYFLERGAEKGLGFELLAWFAKTWKLRTELYPVDEPSDGLRLLENGQADLFLTLESGKRLANVTSTSKSYYEADLAWVSRIEELAEAQGSWGVDAAIDDRLVEEISPSTISSELSVSPKRIRLDDAVEGLQNGKLERFITVMPISRWLETQMRALRVEPYASDSTPSQSPWVFGLRRSAHGLKEALDRFIDDQRGTLTWNVIRNKYLRQKRGTLSRSSPTSIARDQIPYEELFRQYALRFGLDWRLTAAQAQVESGFNPEAVSWVGARGIMQVMPATAQELGIANLHRVENGLEAGMKYLSWLMERFEPTLDYRQRLRFALASYNIGLGHVRDARRLAKKLGLDSNRWFGNVERAMLKLREPKYFKRARYGYCRGGEAVAYVSKIQKLYDVYVQSYGP